MVKHCTRLLLDRCVLQDLGLCAAVIFVPLDFVFDCHPHLRRIGNILFFLLPTNPVKKSKLAVVCSLNTSGLLDPAFPHEDVHL